MKEITINIPAAEQHPEISADQVQKLNEQIQLLTKAVQQMNVNTQSKEAENKFADIYALFDSYDVISLNTNRSVVTGRNGRRERHHSLN